MEQVRKGSVEIGIALKNFQIAIVDDPRVGPAHISLYLAILHFAEQQYKEPVSVFSRDLMRYAKISGVATYIKCVQELQEMGFIKYVPSYNPVLGSLFYVVGFEK
jgi:replication initiation and membrane attachment protein DnaB